MNDLVTVRINDNMYKFGLKGRKYKPKNIQIYLNDILNTEKYTLKTFGFQGVAVYKNQPSSLFFGVITKGKNKKLFDMLKNIVRIYYE